jgi:hypothetical protein
MNTGSVGNVFSNDPVITGKHGKHLAWYEKILEWSRNFSVDDLFFSVDDRFLSEQRHILLSKKDSKNLRGLEYILVFYSGYFSGGSFSDACH